MDSLRIQASRCDWMHQRSMEAFVFTSVAFVLKRILYLGKIQSGKVDRMLWEKGCINAGAWNSRWCNFGLDHFHCKMFNEVSVVFVINASLSDLVPPSLISLSVWSCGWFHNLNWICLAAVHLQDPALSVLCLSSMLRSVLLFLRL